jgi:hypothetical protein
MLAIGVFFFGAKKLPSYLLARQSTQQFEGRRKRGPEAQVAPKPEAK